MMTDEEKEMSIKRLKEKEDEIKGDVKELLKKVEDALSEMHTHYVDRRHMQEPIKETNEGEYNDELKYRGELDILAYRKRLNQIKELLEKED
jgi:hypothetical protein